MTSKRKTRKPDKSTQRNQQLLLVFIHGFKGGEKSTFSEYPQKVTDIVHETYPHLHVNPIIYPTYETRGSLPKAVESFVDWLTTKCVELECGELQLRGDTGNATADGAGSVKVVLCGHSMGGLVAVDAALEVAKSRPASQTKLWPRICGVIAFDTPYCGVHPHVFKNTANKYHGYLQTARSMSTQLAPVGAALSSWWGASRGGESSQSSNGSQRSGSALWSKALLATGAIAVAGGAAAGTYFGGGWTYISDHLLFVSNLWDNQGLKMRLDSLIDLPQVFFHALYNRLPPLNSEDGPRTFVILPKEGHTVDSFEAVDNRTAADEIDAHTSMFYSSNSAYEHIGKRTAALIVRCLENEDEYGDQTRAQVLGDLEHGASDEEAYPED